MKSILKMFLAIILLVVILALSPLGFVAGLIWVSSAWWMWLGFGISTLIGAFIIYALSALSQIEDNHYYD